VSEHLLFIVAMLIVALLNAGAMAVRSTSRIWLRHWAEQRLRGSESVMLYLERPQRLIAAANAGIALALCAAGLWVGWRSAKNETLAMATLGTYATIAVLLGHIVPRLVGRRWPSLIIPLTMPILRATEIVTTPLLALGAARVDAAAQKAHPEEPHEVMQDLLREGELEGVGRHEEIAIISGVMEFGEKMVGDVITPRRDVFAIAEGQDARTVAALIAESKFSRVPVYRGSLDTVVGMYHAFDVLKEGIDQLPPLRPVAYAAVNTPCNELLFRMLRARMHLAVVHDERGHTAGIATLENLLEELVGDIRDEHDEPVTPLSSPTSA